MSEQYAWEKPFFKNREEAARLLAGRLTDYQGQNPLVLAIPRGAVPMGQIIAEALGGELDVILVHKVGAPDNPELALGAVSENGEFYEASFTRSLGYSEESLQAEIQKQIQALKKRRQLYLSKKAPYDAGEGSSSWWTTASPPLPPSWPPFMMSGPTAR